MIHKSVNEKILCTMIGILQSAAYVANRLDQPGYARDLIQEEILDFNLADIAGCKKIAKEEGIDLKKVWKERFRLVSNDAFESLKDFPQIEKF